MESFEGDATNLPAEVKPEENALAVRPGANALLAPAPELQVAMVQIELARRQPRDLDAIAAAVKAEACRSIETATDCVWEMERWHQGKKTKLLGQSVRLAEIVGAEYPNTQVDVWLNPIDYVLKQVSATARFFDLETNRHHQQSARRSIAFSEKGKMKGQIYGADMIRTTMDAVQSVAYRNVVFRCVPRRVWIEAYEGAVEMLEGDSRSVGKNSSAMLEAFKEFGVDSKMILESLGLSKVKEIEPSHIALLRVQYAKLKKGQASVAEIFSPEEDIDAGEQTGDEGEKQSILQRTFGGKKDAE